MRRSRSKSRGTPYSFMAFTMFTKSCFIGIGSCSYCSSGIGWYSAGRPVTRENAAASSSPVSASDAIGSVRPPHSSG